MVSWLGLGPAEDWKPPVGPLRRGDEAVSMLCLRESQLVKIPEAVAALPRPFPRAILGKGFSNKILSLLDYLRDLRGIISVRQIEQGPAIRAALLQTGEIAAIAYVPAVIEPTVMDAGDEDAAAMRPAGPPAGVRDPDRGREAQALRRAAVKLRLRHHRLLQIPTLACGRERGSGECQHQCESESASHARSPQKRCD